MRKTISLGLTLVMVVSLFAFVGCKKGENDSMSLLTRKARITGEWELIEADYTSTYPNGSDKYSFNGSTMVNTDTYDGVTESYTYTYSEVAIIEKDGTFEMTENVIADGYTSTTTTEGLWYFLDGSKELEVKDKERVEFLVTKETSRQTYDGQTDTDTDTYDGRSNSAVYIMLLDRLAKKELVVLLDAEVRDDGGWYNTESGTKTYEKTD